MTSPAPVQRPAYAPLRGRLYWWAGVVTIAVGFLIASAGGLQEPPDGSLLFPGIVILLIGVKIWYRGKQYAATPGEEAESKDPRPPVVFLRSFNDELADKTPWSVIRNPFSDRRLAKEVPPGSPYERDLMERLFKKVGPYLAIGRPGESFADPGPARFYLPDDKWQDFVVSRLRRAQLVIIRAGVTPGLGWEMEQVVALVPPRKIIILLPMRRRDYAPFQKWAGALLPKPLPAVAPKAERLLTFDADWTPVVLPTQNRMDESFAPFFERNGIVLK